MKAPPFPSREQRFRVKESCTWRTEGYRSAGPWVAETFATGLNDVWVVRGTGREYLIPVIADVVREIDRDARRIVIEPMPGLLDG